MLAACEKLAAELLGNTTVSTTTFASSYTHSFKHHDYLTSSIYCDGVYRLLSDYSQFETLYYDCGLGFNVDNFEISFDYYLTNVGFMPMIVLGRSHRMFEIRITNKHNRIEVTTHNGRYSYETNIFVLEGTWERINVRYDHGDLFINKQHIRIHPLEKQPDNILTSMNFSNGFAYKGWIRNIVVSY